MSHGHHHHRHNSCPSFAPYFSVKTPPLTLFCWKPFPKHKVTYIARVHAGGHVARELIGERESDLVALVHERGAVRARDGEVPGPRVDGEVDAPARRASITRACHNACTYVAHLHELVVGTENILLTELVLARDVGDGVNKGWVLDRKHRLGPLESVALTVVPEPLTDARAHAGHVLHVKVALYLVAVGEATSGAIASDWHLTLAKDGVEEVKSAAAVLVCECNHTLVEEVLYQASDRCV